MKIQEDMRGDELVVSLAGSLDDMTSRGLEDQLDKLLSTEKPFLRFDLAKVEYISSTGIRVLILAHKKAVKQGKKVLLGEMSDKVHGVFDMLGILPLFKK